MTSDRREHYPSSLFEKSYAESLLDDRTLLLSSEQRTIYNLAQIKNLFFSEDWVYIVCDRIASLISSQYLRVMRDVISNGQKIPEPAEDHPLQKRLENPNSEQDYHTWMYTIVIDEVLMGNAMIWRAPASDQLLLMPSELTSIDTNELGQITGYRVSSSDDFFKKAIRFKPEEVCHIRRPNPSSRIYGLSPFLPASKSVAFNRFTAEYLNNFYMKGAQPGLIIELADGANVTKAIRTLRSFENAYSGRQNQRKTLMLPKGFTAKELNQSLADQQLIEYINSNRETILNILQVPKHEVGLDAGRSLGSGEEYRISRSNFWSGQLKSIMRRIAGSFSKFFASELGENYYLEFDLSDVDALQEDEDKKADLAQKLLATHTLNEVREKLYALSPLPEGDTIQGTQPQLPVVFSQEPSPNLNEAFRIVSDVSKGLISRSEAVTILQNIFKFDLEKINTLLGPEKKDQTGFNLKRFERLKQQAPDFFEESDKRLERAGQEAYPKMLKNVFDLFQAQADSIMTYLARYKEAPEIRLKELPDKRTLKKNLKELLKKLQDQYIDGYYGALSAQAETGYDSTIVVSFGKEDQDKLQAIRERNKDNRRLILEERGLKGFVKINETTSERIMLVIEEGIKNQASIETIIDTIANDFRDIPNIRKRAEVIARTEVMTAASVGQAAALKDAERVIGPMKKMWINANDERVRQGKYDHVILQGEVVDSDERFSNGLLYPRDPSGDAGDVIQCRCRIVAVAAEDMESIDFGGLEDQGTAGGDL